jgi:hypothetical protein
MSTQIKVIFDDLMDEIIQGEPEKPVKTEKTEVKKEVAEPKPVQVELESMRDPFFANTGFGSDVFGQNSMFADAEKFMSEQMGGSMGGMKNLSLFNRNDRERDFASFPDSPSLLRRNNFGGIMSKEFPEMSSSNFSTKDFIWTKETTWEKVGFKMKRLNFLQKTIIIRGS